MEPLWTAAQTLSPGKIFMRSQNLVVPTEFHQLIMQNPVDSGFVESARRIGIADLDDFFLAQAARVLKKDSRSELLARKVELAGDLNRHVYIDHIGWFDETKREPVWTIVYRAFKDRPTPRKPPKLHSKSQQTEEGWQRGDLVPVPGR